MKKNFLFATLAVLLAGFWFGGASLATECADRNAIVACVNGTTGYDTITGATLNAPDNATVVINSGNYVMPNTGMQWIITNNITIEGSGDVVLDLSDETLPTYADTDTTMVNIPKGVTFSGITFNFPIGIPGSNFNHYGFAEGGDVKFNNCTIVGGYNSKSNVTFDNCVFSGVLNGASSITHYNITTFSGDLIVKNSTFNSYGRFINAIQIVSSEDEVGDYKINVDNTVFNRLEGGKKKSAIIVREAAGNHSYTAHSTASTTLIPLKYKVNISYVTLNGDFPEGTIGTGYYSIDYMLTGATSPVAGVTCYASKCHLSDEAELGAKSYGTLNGGNVVVTLNGEEVYTTPSYAEARIGTTLYATVTGAIAAATQGQTVEIIKSGNYTLPPTISTGMTIKGVTSGVNFGHSVSSTNDQVISNIMENVTFDGVTFILSGSAAQHHFGQASGKKITMKNCVIDGILHVRGNIDFEGCVFQRKNTPTLGTNFYNLHINYGNVNFDNCTFTNNNSKNINIAYGGDDTYNINFKNTKFSHSGDVNKPAVLIHEIYKQNDYGYENSGNVATYIAGGDTYVIGKWNVSFDSESEVNSTYGSTFVGGSQLFGLEDVYTESGVPAQGSSTDELYGSLTGGEVTVTVNNVVVYSTPKHGATWTVTFDGSGVVVADGAKVAKPADPSKSCYTFDEWQLNGVAYDFNSVVTGNLALTSHWKDYSCGGSSGGGGGGGSSKTTKTDTKTTTGDAKNLTGDDTKVDDKKLDETKTEDNLVSSDESTTDGVLADGYTQEFNDAYEFAFKNGITTMPSIQEANMEGTLTRIAMAKMLSQYAINVLGKKPANIIVPNFPDVSAELDEQYNNGVALAYQLGIMGINIENFRPNDLVTRAEFGTALSRLLYGTADGEGAYYETHLQKLMDEKIITNDNPDLQELRGYVMIMLMRSANK